MDQITMNDADKKQYTELITAAREIEQAIGTTYVRLTMMADTRKKLDADIKTWWDSVSETYKIDKSKDYFVTPDGVIKLSDKPAVPEQAKGETDGGASEVKKEESNEGESQEGSAKEESSPDTGNTEDVDNKEGGTATDLT